jgi:hypothetical protein
MAITFTTSSNWGLVVLDPAVIDGGDNPPGAPFKAPSGYKWQRVEQTLIRERFGNGLLTSTPESGSLSQAGSGITVYNGADSFSLPGGETWDLDDDQLYPEVSGSGMWRHVQQWVHYGDWYEVGVDYS